MLERVDFRAAAMDQLLALVKQSVVRAELCHSYTAVT